jgi:hypothetical protein
VAEEEADPDEAAPSEAEGGDGPAPITEGGAATSHYTM